MTPLRAVQWNRHKYVYDAGLVAGVALYVTAFLVLAPMLFPSAPPVSWGILRLRALGSCAFLMLTIILCIGPLARLDRHFLPLLYNRRHFGVLTFLVALAHAWLAIDWYHGNGRLPPLVSLLTSNPHYLGFTGFPFELLGAAALAILFVMAATSHDFWLAFLGPPVWKAMHMLVYLAWALLAMHVALGVMESELSPLLPSLLILAVAVVAALHSAAARAERSRDRAVHPVEGWLEVGPARAIPEGRASVVTPPEGERIAVFRHDGRLSAVANLCTHQNGPLGEGRIIDGCITCPWHGFQFRPADGSAPPPFTDRISTHRLRLAGRHRPGRSAAAAARHICRAAPDRELESHERAPGTAFLCRLPETAARSPGLPSEAGRGARRDRGRGRRHALPQPAAACVRGMGD